MEMGRSNFLDCRLNDKGHEGRSPVETVKCNLVTKYCHNVHTQQCCITNTILTFISGNGTGFIF